MDQLANKVILELQRGANETGIGTEYICAFSSAWDSTCNTEISDFSRRIGESTENVRAAVRYLEEEGYIEYQYANGKSGKIAAGFHLSHRGTIYEDIQAKEKEIEQLRQTEVEAVRDIAAAATKQAELAQAEAAEAKENAKAAKRDAIIARIISIISVAIALAGAVPGIVALFR